MGQQDETPRRRCCECRSWYTPAPSTGKTQKTCGKKCRLRRRGKQEKARRAADLPATRKLERARKRCQRERQATLEGTSLKGTNLPMSRAGLTAEVAGGIEEIIEKLGQAERMSRAGLHRQIKRLFAGTIEFAGAQVGT
jgi:hypothetical protein